MIGPDGRLFERPLVSAGTGQPDSAPDLLA